MWRLHIINQNLIVKTLMTKNYITTPKVRENKKEPSETVLQNILNYSKSLEVKTTKQETYLVHLN